MWTSIKVHADLAPLHHLYPRRPTSNLLLLGTDPTKPEAVGSLTHAVRHAGRCPSMPSASRPGTTPRGVGGAGPGGSGRR